MERKFCEKHKEFHDHDKGCSSCLFQSLCSLSVLIGIVLLGYFVINSPGALVYSLIVGQSFQESFDLNWYNLIFSIGFWSALFQTYHNLGRKTVKADPTDSGSADVPVISNQFKKYMFINDWGISFKQLGIGFTLLCILFVMLTLRDQSNEKERSKRESASKAEANEIIPPAGN